MDQNLRRILADLRRRLEETYGDRLVRLVLFGSQARGDAGPDSDIDVLIVLKGPLDFSTESRRTSRTVSDLSLEHDVVILCHFMDEEEFHHQQGPLLRNIMREGVFV